MAKKATPKNIFQSVLRCLTPVYIMLALLAGTFYTAAITDKTPKHNHLVVTAKSAAPTAKKPSPAAKSTAAAQPTAQPAPTPKAATPVPASPHVAAQPAASLPKVAGAKTEPVVTPAPASSVSGLAPTTTPAPATTSTTAPPASPPATTTSYSSLNWSGYMAANATYTSVSGSWIAPQATGNGTSTSADSTWVGIGGVSSGDLIQTGTQNTVSADGHATSSAWYELLPASSQTIPSISVSPGDLMSATISQLSGSQWTISITDKTTNQNFSTSVAYTSSTSSAEWIEENPSYSSRNLVPFDNFGTVNFSAGLTTRNGMTANINNSLAQPIIMVDKTGKPLATPSGLGADGASFSVTHN